MNQYGRQAQIAWQTRAPVAYAGIKDPKTFFSELGEQAADQVVDLAYQIAGPDLPGEDFFSKLGRWNMARRQAEEIVRADLLTPQQEFLAQSEEEEPLTGFLQGTWEIDLDEYLAKQDRDSTDQD